MQYIAYAIYMRYGQDGGNQRQMGFCANTNVSRQSLRWIWRTMDDRPSAKKKQKIKDRGILRKLSGAAIIFIVYIGRIAARAEYTCHYILWMFLFIDCHSGG